MGRLHDDVRDGCTRVEVTLKPREAELIVLTSMAVPVVGDRVIEAEGRLRPL